MTRLTKDELAFLKHDFHMMTSLNVKMPSHHRLISHVEILLKHVESLQAEIDDKTQKTIEGVVK